jgi:CHAT domain
MPGPTYLNFDLLVERAGDDCVARVLQSPAGDTRGRVFTLPFDHRDLEHFFLRMVAVGRRVRRVESPEMALVKDFGGDLFDTVFDGDVLRCLTKSLDRADQRGAGLRIRLRIEDVLHAPVSPGAVETGKERPAVSLADIPWEFLYDRSTDEFLALQRASPLVRYAAMPESVGPLSVEAPLRILVMMSSPRGYAELQVEREWEKLQQALGDLTSTDKVTLERLRSPTLEALRRQFLRGGPYHIFHFIGHGQFNEKVDDGELLLETASGQPHPVSGQKLAHVLAQHDSIRLVVLNACEGARGSAEDPFAGSAQTLIRVGIPAVIAMQLEITDESAILLSSEFYTTLADGYPIDTALCEARTAIYTDVSPLEWAIPVLYMRSEDGSIFQIGTAELEERERRRREEEAAAAAAAAAERERQEEEERRQREEEAAAAERQRQEEEERRQREEQAAAERRRQEQERQRQEEERRQREEERRQREDKAAAAAAAERRRQEEERRRREEEAAAAKRQPRGEERRWRTRRRVAAVAVGVALLALLALLIGLLTRGEGSSDGDGQPPSGRRTLDWQRAAGAELGGPGDQGLTSIVDTSRGGLAYLAGGYDASAGSLDAAVWTLEDGGDWRRREDESFAGPGDQKINGVGDGAWSFLVAVGSDGSNGDLDAALWRSSDGASWEAVAGLRLPGGDEEINRITGRIGGGWRTGEGKDGAVWRFDPDGTPQADAAPIRDAALGGPGDQWINRVRPFGGEFVAVGFDDGDAGVWVSPKGQRWNRIDAAALGGDGEQEILDAAIFDSQLVAVGVERVDGETSGAVWRLRDGENWERVPDPERTFSTSSEIRLNRVDSTDGLSGVPALIAGGSAGEDAAVWTSEDGERWVRELDPSGSFGAMGQAAIQSLRVDRLPVLAVGSAGSEDGSDAAVWSGDPLD